MFYLKKKKKESAKIFELFPCTNSRTSSSMNNNNNNTWMNDPAVNTLAMTVSLRVMIHQFSTIFNEANETYPLPNM